MSNRGTPAGWYPDPERHGYQRYWDGYQWTENYAPLQAAPVQQPQVVYVQQAPVAPVGKGGIGRQKLSKASGGTGACPRCGSTALKAKRSVKGKVAVGVLAPKTQVKCVGCGHMFKRG